MSNFDFVEKVMCIGGNGTPDLQFYKKGFNLNYSGATPSWQDIILSGNTALTLVNSKANGLNYLKLFGGTEQRNLPSGYTQLQYIESTGTQYIDTGVIPTVENETEIRLTLARTSQTTSEGSGANANLNIVNTTANWRLNGVQTTVPIVDNEFVNIVLKQTSNGRYYKIKTSEGYGSANAQNNKFYLGKLSDVSGSENYSFNGKYKACTILENGTIVQNLIPARRNSDSVLGMYDTVTGTFFTNAGTGDFIAGADVVPSPDTPMDIYCNNGAVKVSKNLFDKYTAQKMYGSIQSDGRIQYINTPGDAQAGCYEMKVKPNTQYTLSIAPNNTTIFRILSLSDKWDGVTTTTGTLILYGTTETQYTFTTPNDTSYIYFQTNYAKWETVLESIQLEQGSTVTPYMPYGQIYTDGTTETVEITGKNLLDTTSIITGYRLNVALNVTYGGSSGAVTDFVTDTSYYVSNLIPVEVGKTYIKNSPLADAYHRFKVYNASKVAVRISSANSITIQSGEAYIAFCGLQTELTTAYCGELLGTATAEMLLKVGDYQDEQEVLTGSVTKNIGIKVLDGTEDWGTTAQSMIYRWSSPVIFSLPNVGICSHYVGVDSSLAIASMPNKSMKTGSQTASYVYIKDSSFDNNLTGFKQYLADQYANGTPVIIVYPLATATTETVTGQSLTTQAGTNIVEITQASIDNLGLEVSYKATV